MLLTMFIILFPVTKGIIMAVIKNITVQESLSLTCYNQAEARSKVELGVYCEMDNRCMAVSSDVKGAFPFTRCECPTNPGIANMLPLELASILSTRLYEGQHTGSYYNNLHLMISGGCDDKFIT